MTGKPRRGRHRSEDDAPEPTTDPTPPGGPEDEPLDPAEVAAAELLANPEVIQRQLDADLAQVAEMGRGGVTVDPSLAVERLVLAIREQAEKLDFGSPVASALAAREHGEELPLGEWDPAAPIQAYHVSASRTVANGEVVRDHVGYDGDVNLVFHRRGAEPNDTTVRLEAVVSVGPDGAVRLSHYGWPTVAIEQPVHSFGGTADKYADQLVADLTEAVKRLGDAPEPDSLAGVDPMARGHFARAMLMAFGFAIAQHRDGYLPGDRLRELQDEVVPLVARGAVLLADYLEKAFDDGERGGLYGWTSACVRRSAVEALFAGFVGSAAFELIDAETLIELHQVIDDAAADLEQVGKPPEGLPRYNHDWWFPGRSF